MKTLIKFMTLIVIGFIVCICLVYLINVNIMINEMDSASKIAIDSCQRIVKSKIIDDYIDLDGFAYPIYDNESYKNYFVSSFNNLVKDKDLYDLDVSCDFDKGLLAVYIHNKYSSFINDKKLISIIEVAE